MIGCFPSTSLPRGAAAPLGIQRGCCCDDDLEHRIAASKALSTASPRPVVVSRVAPLPESDLAAFTHDALLERVGDASVTADAQTAFG